MLCRRTIKTLKEFLRIDFRLQTQRRLENQERGGKFKIPTQNLKKTVIWLLKKNLIIQKVLLDWVLFNGTTVNGIIRVMESN